MTAAATAAPPKPAKRSGLTPVMLNHAAWVTHDVEATANFYMHIMGMELASTVYDDKAPSTGDDFPYFHIFFRMQDGSTIAFFEAPGLPPRPEISHPAYEIFDHIAIRGVDRLGNGRVPAAVIMCTNRLSALDPAVRRRAADILAFARPDDMQRRAVLGPSLKELGFSPTQIDALVEATGARKTASYGFTFSDLTQRLLPAIVLDAYPAHAVNAARALDIAHNMTPTAPFLDSAS